jgi:hypothetical protein
VRITFLCAESARSRVLDKSSCPAKHAKDTSNRQAFFARHLPPGQNSSGQALPTETLNIK